jgi:cell division protein FtsZ
MPRYFESSPASEPGAKIRVVGVGGGGGNALNTMISARLEGVDFICVNTDRQALSANAATTKVQIGEKLTRGLGAGADPQTGWKAANEDQARVSEMLTGSDMVFVTAGMGGGTGTGAAPVIAQVAREAGALTVGVVTKPFDFEGKQRMRRAEEGIRALSECVDTLIVIPNQRLLSVAGADMSLIDAFRCADDVLLNAVRGISDLITTPGLINVDFADVKTIMSSRGLALMGTGRGQGERRAVEAAQRAIASPLLEDTSIEGATGILINVTGGVNLTLREVNDAVELVQRAAHEDANVIFGTVIDSSLNDEVYITVVATGFDYAQLGAQAHQNRGAYARPPQALDNRRFGGRPEMAAPPEPPMEAMPVTVAAPSASRPRISPAAAAAEAAPARDDYERPAYQRRQEQGRPEGEAPARRGFSREPIVQNPFNQNDMSEFDTPTFLRR